MIAADILIELETLGEEPYKQVLVRNHGVKEPCFGVKIELLKKIQKRIKRDYSLALALYDTGIHQAPDQVRRAMNMFLIRVGSYVTPLTETVVRAGKSIGPVKADLDSNDCRIPYIPDYIEKVRARGNLGKKRKTVKC